MANENRRHLNPLESISWTFFPLWILWPLLRWNCIDAFDCCVCLRWKRPSGNPAIIIPQQFRHINSFIYLFISFFLLLLLFCKMLLSFGNWLGSFDWTGGRFRTAVWRLWGGAGGILWDSCGDAFLLVDWKVFKVKCSVEAPMGRWWDADVIVVVSTGPLLLFSYNMLILFCLFNGGAPPPPPPLPPPPLPLTSMALVTPDRNPCPIWGTFHPWRSGWITLLLQFRILFEGCSKILGTNQCLQPRLNETKSLNSWSEIHQGPVWTTEAVDWRRRRLKRCDWCADQRQGFSAVLAFIAANLFGLKIGNSTEEVVYE